MRQKPQIKAIITDVDNTLLDWMGQYIQPMQRFVEKIGEIAGVDPETLYPEIREINRRHATSEYGFVLQEMPTVARVKAERGDTRPVTETYKEAIDTYCRERDERLKLYPDVSKVFQMIHDRGTRIIAFTESQAFYTFTRFKKLGLDGLIDTLYTPADTAVPNDVDLRQSRSHAPDYYHFRHTEHLLLPEGTRKPDPEMLLQIVAEQGFKPHEVLMVGDHLWKDVHMTQQAGVHDVHAAYGSYGDTNSGNDYANFMPKISYYPANYYEMEREARAGAGAIKPTTTLDLGMVQLYQHFNFVAAPKRVPRVLAHPVIHPTPL